MFALLAPLLSSSETFPSGMHFKMPLANKNLPLFFTSPTLSTKLNELWLTSVLFTSCLGVCLCQRRAQAFQGAMDQF